jgi:hypothetical protein
MEKNTKAFDLRFHNLLIDPTNNKYQKCLMHLLYIKKI